MKNKAVEKVEEVTQKAVALAPAPELGGEEILAADVVIPYVLLMQGLSDLVNERKAQQGDIVRSTTAEVLGGPTKVVEFIPITFKNEWILQEKIGGKYEFRGREKRDVRNEDLPWDFEKNGAEWKRVKSLQVFALLPSDVAAERAEMEKAKRGEPANPDKALVPVAISFRSTSFPAGREIITHFAKARKFGQPGYVSVLGLECAPEKNEKGSYYVYKVKSTGKKVSAEDQEVAKYWASVLATQKVALDDTIEGEVAPQAVGVEKF